MTERFSVDFAMSSCRSTADKEEELLPGLTEAESPPPPLASISTGSPIGCIQSPCLWTTPPQGYAPYSGSAAVRHGISEYFWSGSHDYYANQFRATFRTGWNVQSTPSESPCSSELDVESEIYSDSSTTGCDEGSDSDSSAPIVPISSSASMCSDDYDDGYDSDDEAETIDDSDAEKVQVAPAIKRLRLILPPTPPAPRVKSIRLLLPPSPTTSAIISESSDKHEGCGSDHEC